VPLAISGSGKGKRREEMRRWLLRRPDLALIVSFFVPAIVAIALFLIYGWIGAWLWPEFFSLKWDLWSIAKSSIAVGGGFLFFCLFPLVWMYNKLDDYIFGSKEATRRAVTENLSRFVEQMRKEGKTEAEINEEINRIMFDS